MVSVSRISISFSADVSGVKSFSGGMFRWYGFDSSVSTTPGWITTQITGSFLRSHSTARVLVTENIKQIYINGPLIIQIFYLWIEQYRWKKNQFHIHWLRLAFEARYEYQPPRRLSLRDAILHVIFAMAAAPLPVPSPFPSFSNGIICYTFIYNLA